MSEIFAWRLESAVFGGRPKCSKCGDFFVTECLVFLMEFRISVRAASFEPEYFINVVPSLRLIVWMQRSTAPFALWSSTGQNF